MELRPSSPPGTTTSPRPHTHRKRSNSFPIVEALGCTSAEAELILRESRAAVNRRHPTAQRPGRRHRSVNDKTIMYRPQDHIHYLYGKDVAVEEEPSESEVTDGGRATLHTRIPSNATDGSTSTVTASVQPSVQETRSACTSPTVQDYKANLANFIKSQLKSIPSYQTTSLDARSCPDLRMQKMPTVSPTRSLRKPVEKPHIIELPALRPPLRSAFSAWSSADDDTDDEASLFTNTEPHDKAYTPSLLQYSDQQSSNGSFLFTSTPSDEEHINHPNAEGFSFPVAAPLLPSASDSSVHSPIPHEDYPSAASHPALTNSSAPSISTTSTTSYFDHKRLPHLREKVIQAVSPMDYNSKVLTAISPFDGAALTRVHDILIESQNRVVVEGLPFDLLRDMRVPGDGMQRMPTPC